MWQHLKARKNSIYLHDSLTFTCTCVVNTTRSLGKELMLEKGKVKTHCRLTDGSLVLSRRKLGWNFNGTWALLLDQKTDG